MFWTYVRLGNETSHSFHIHSKDPHSYQNVSRRHSSQGTLPHNTEHVLGIFYYKILSLQLFLENQDYGGTHHIEHKMPRHLRACDESNTHDPLGEEMCASK